MTPNGVPHPIDAPAGVSLMRAAKTHGLDMQAACNGAMACATCHVIVTAAWFPRLAPATEGEEDMLDVVPYAVGTSRLSCQITITPELDGLTVRLPKG